MATVPVNTNFAFIASVSKVTLGKFLGDGVKHIWAFPSAYMPHLTEPQYTLLSLRITVTFHSEGHETLEMESLFLLLG